MYPYEIYHYMCKGIGKDSCLFIDWLFEVGLILYTSWPGTHYVVQDGVRLSGIYHGILFVF